MSRMWRCELYGDADLELACVTAHVRTDNAVRAAILIEKALGRLEVILYQGDISEEPVSLAVAPERDTVVFMGCVRQE